MRNVYPASPQVCESRRLARIIGVPAVWLRTELEAGRLSGVRVNDSKALFHRPTVMRELAKLAKHSGEVQTTEQASN